MEAYSVDPITLNVSRVAPKTLPAFFEYRAVPDPEKSQKAGRPIHKEQEFALIWIDEFTKKLFPVTDEIRRKYASSYARFKEKTAPRDIDGTMLEELPWITRSRAADYAALGVYTVEKLAALTDEQCAELGVETEKEREKAKAFLQFSDDVSIVSKQAEQILFLEKQLAQANDDIRALREQLKEHGKEEKERKTRR